MVGKVAAVVAAIAAVTLINMHLLEFIHRKNSTLMSALPLGINNPHLLLGAAKELLLHGVEHLSKVAELQDMIIILL